MGFRLGKWVSWFLLVLAAVALLIPWLASLQARPIEEHFEQDALTLTLALSSDRVFLPSECVTARWQVEGIREVYFNGEGVIGEGQRVICPANGPVSLRVLQMDGTEKTLVANAQVTSISLVSFALYGLALIAVILVCRNGSLPLLNRFWRSCARIVARVPARIVNLGHWLQAHPLVVIPIITLLGAALRFSGVGHRSLILDEAVIELIATGSIGDVIRQNAHMNSAPPLFALAINQVLVLGHTELLLRAIPLFASILVIPAFYVLARRFVTRGAAYLATLVIATALVPVYYGPLFAKYADRLAAWNAAIDATGWKPGDVPPPLPPSKAGPPLLPPGSGAPSHPPAAPPHEEQPPASPPPAATPPATAPSGTQGASGNKAPAAAVRGPQA